MSTKSRTAPQSRSATAHARKRAAARPARPSPARKVPKDPAADVDIARLEAEVTRLRGLNDRIIASIHHPLTVVDPQLRISSCNDAFLAMFPGLADGAQLTEFFNPDGIARLIADVADTGAARLDEEMAIGGTAATAGETPDSQRTFRVAAVRLTSGDQTPLVLLTIDEMTELRIREAQLLESSRLVAIGEMTSGVAHELNNPLTAVLGFSQLALRQQMEDLLRRDIESISSEARRAGRIVDNMLTFARRRDHVMRAFDPVRAVEQVLDLRQYECKVNNIEVVKYVDDSTPRTLADLHQMQQVFLNILNNSIQAIAERRGHGAITVGVVGIGDNIRITFADDAGGIPPEILPRIFDPFFTTKPIGKGTGLGLSICRDIVESHGGTVRADSRPGRGATFTIEIPVVDVEEEAPESSMLEEVVEPGTTMLHILVVDDEPAVTELLTRALASAGHEVVTAADGAKALELLYVNDYDAVILDLKMPGLGGPEVYQCVQSIRPELASRILFTSGDLGSPEAKSFIESTGNPVLRKPFTLDELRRRIDRFALAKIERTATNNGR